MAQQLINFGNAPDGSGGDNRRVALEKLSQNDTELYAAVAAVVPYGGFRNLLINGDGRVNQRVFAGGALAANKYGYDRWRTLGAASSMTVVISTISINGTICQPVEAPDLANATVTVSVSNPSGPINVSLQPDGTTVTTAAGTIPAGAGIQSVKLVVPGTLTGNVYVLLTTAGAVTIDGPAKRAGIQVELGSNASPFERKPIAQELLLCERYYEKSFGVATAPSDGVGAPVYTGIAYNTTSMRSCVPFRARKRVTPTVTLYATNNAAPVAGKWQAFIGGGWVSSASTATVGTSDTFFIFDAVMSNSIVSAGAYILTGNFTLDAEI